MGSFVYSQNDSSRTTLTKPGFSIDYIAGFKNVYNEETKRDNLILYNSEIDHIKKLGFTSDSTVKVTTEDSYEEINIDKINKISFKRGNKMGLGVGIGAVVGFLSGVIYGAVFVSNVSDGKQEFTGEYIGPVTIGGILMAIPGAILGGTFGA